MPTWGEILHEMQQEFERTKAPPFDAVRRKYLTMLHNKTGRNTILYATAWQTKSGDSLSLSITPEDIHGLMEVFHYLDGPAVDLIIHSPGGSPEAAEAFVSYLRSKFDDIRVIVPNAAMSAATMLACSSNRILMGEHSFLGPVDPQLIIQTSDRVQSVPAQAIIDQFELAKKECVNPVTTVPWVPILSQYAPALLIQCREAQKLAAELASQWLRNYMFKGDSNAAKKAARITRYLTSHRRFKSHGRTITREQARSTGLIVEDLESDSELQDLVLGVFHATMQTFNGTNAMKIVENHLGKAFVKVQQIQTIAVPRPEIIPEKKI